MQTVCRSLKQERSYKLIRCMRPYLSLLGTDKEYSDKQGLVCLIRWIYNPHQSSGSGEEETGTDGGLVSRRR
jgi:hypothetical protein